MQVDQIADAVFAALRLRPARVGQDGRHLGVGKSRMRANHGGEKLVCRDFAVGGHEHVAHHGQAVLIRVE